MRLFIVGFAVSIAGGVIGLGGAELRLPFLVGVLGLTPRTAVPINLAVSLVTVAAALPFRMASLDTAALVQWWDIAAALTAGAMLAAYWGAGWLRTIGSHALARTIAALLVLLGIIMIAEAFLPLSPDGALAGLPGTALATAAVAFGMVIGTVSSLLGVAGGELIIPTLVVGYGAPVVAAGTLSLCISLPTILVGIVRHARAGAFSDGRTARTIILPLALGALLGAPIGGVMAAFVPAAPIKFLLGALLIWSAWKAFIHVAHR